MQKLIFVLVCVAAAVQADLKVGLQRTLVKRFNTTELVLLQNLQDKFFAWKNSATPSDQVLMDQTTQEIERALTTLFKKCEMLAIKAGKFDDIPEATKLAIQKKFNSTGYGMRDEIVAMFQAYLGHRNEATLFGAVGQLVPMKMAQLMTKVEGVVEKAQNQGSNGNSNGGNNGNNNEQGGMTPELEGNISDMFNTTKNSLLGELQGRFEAWRDSPNPNDQALIQETTNVIEGFLTNLFMSGEQYIMESGNYDTEEIPSDAKAALEKKFNSTGYGMRDDIVAAFQAYLGDRDETKLFDFVGSLVPQKMDQLRSKVELVVGNAEKYKPSKENGNNNGGNQGGMTPELEGNISDMFNTTKNSLLGELQGRFEAWRDSPNPNDQALIQETTNVIEGFLTNLFVSGEQYIMESGNYNTEEIPSDAKAALEKKFNSTGYGMRDDIVAAFQAYLGDRDETKLFDFVGSLVPQKMDQLRSKVEGVVGQANKFNPSKGGKGEETKVDGLSDKTTDDLASRFSGSLDGLLDDMKSVFEDWQNHGNDAKLMKVVEQKLNKQLTTTQNKAERLLKKVNKGKNVSSKVKNELKKKFSSTGQKMVDEVKGAFEAFLQTKDQVTLFSNTERIVKMRFGILETKVQGVAKKVEQ